MQTIQTHNITGNHNDDITIKQEFTYDRMSRLLSTKETVNNVSQVTSNNVYNELGQLKTKQLHKNGNSYLQDVDYSYNIRGWMTDINNANDLGNDFFAMKLKYTDGGQFNGNISGTEWISSTFSDLKTYDYSYDGANRILSATDNLNHYSTSYTYDANGNIKTLTRKGEISDGVYGTIDNLDYEYAKTNELSNKLYIVNDLSNIQNGFADNGFGTSKEYFFDANGNLTQDNNKKITGITYNHLNLPENISISTTKNLSIKYTYDAAGIKLSKQAGTKTTGQAIFLGS